MRPRDVAADDALLQRFRDEVAYCGRRQPSPDELRDDTDLLRSPDGILVVAWHWPVIRGDAVPDPFGNPRESQREDSAKLLRLLLSSSARQIVSSEGDIEAHLRWTVPLTSLELERLLRGDADMPFRVIQQICHALHLRFTDAWEIEDPQRLDRRIARSVLASSISNGLRRLTLESLQSLARKLPRSAFLDLAQAEQGSDFGTALPSEPDGRYRPLYDALAADDRASPTYSVSEINRVLADGGVPGSATDPRRGRSWWAGSGMKTAGRPQVQAWWAAGYRVQKVDLRSGCPDTQMITFEALPERAEWLADPARPTWSEYRATGPVRVRLDLKTAERLEDLVGKLDPKRWSELLSPIASALELVRRENVPDDGDIRLLIEFLDEVGEVDRAHIEREFGDVWDDPVQITNLLTRARRQGWIVNKGTRRQPSWAATRTRTRLIAAIADKRNLTTPTVDPAEPVPINFLRSVAHAIDVDPAGNTSVEIAKEIVQALGRDWSPSFESADGSVTSLGLQTISDGIATVWRPSSDDPQ